MSNFLLIMPQGWVQLDLTEVVSQAPECQIGAIEGWILIEQFQILEDSLKAIGMIAAEASIAEVKILDNSFLLLRLR